MFVYLSPVGMCVYECVFVFMDVYFCDPWTCVYGFLCVPSLGQVQVCGSLCLCDVQPLRV